MASKLPAVKNSAFVFRCVLFAQSDNQIKSNPTLASGDWKVSIDGGAFANLATLPDVDPDSSVQVKVSLSADEMNGDEIMVTAIDAAGAEWHSAAWVIHTAAQTFDTIEGLVDELETRLTAARAGYLDNLSAGAVALEATAQDIPTNAELNAAIAAGDDAVLAAIGDLNDLDATAVQSAAAAALTAYDPPTKAELDAGLAATDDAVLAAISALNNLSSAGAQAAAAAALAAYDAATGADVSGLSTFDPTADAVIVGSIQTDAVSAASIAAAAANEIADAVLLRSYSHVEDTAGDHSLAALIAGALESAIAGTTWTIYKTDGVTTMLTKTVATDGAAEPITGVA